MACTCKITFDKCRPQYMFAQCFLSCSVLVLNIDELPRPEVPNGLRDPERAGILSSSASNRYVNFIIRVR